MSTSFFFCFFFFGCLFGLFFYNLIKKSHLTILLKRTGFFFFLHYFYFTLFKYHVLSTDNCRIYITLFDTQQFIYKVSQTTWTVIKWLYFTPTSNIFKLHFSEQQNCLFTEKRDTSCEKEDRLTLTRNTIRVDSYWLWAELFFPVQFILKKYIQSFSCLFTISNHAEPFYHWTCTYYLHELTVVIIFTLFFNLSSFLFFVKHFYHEFPAQENGQPLHVSQC